nr:unnamed protein product [Digitaria exilis]
MQPQAPDFLQLQREEDVVIAMDHMLGKAVDVKDAVGRASLLAELKCADFQAACLMEPAHGCYKLRDSDKTVDPWKEKFKDDDGIELMIPAYVDDFPAQVILAFVESADIDITEEFAVSATTAKDFQANTRRKLLVRNHRTTKMPQIQDHHPTKTQLV